MTSFVCPDLSELTKCEHLSIHLDEQSKTSSHNLTFMSLPNISSVDGELHYPF